MEQAREYWQRVDRPNLMIKIPGTLEGVPAIEEMIYEGRNINVTLLFAVQAYEQVAEAYIRGLERRHAEGKSVDVRSVASFFVSRVDTEVDKRLEKLGRTDLKGRAGLANARAAYQRFMAIFHGERFAELEAAGAPVQRPLWASTGVKDPAYPDTMYVDGLIGPETVNTMPMATLMAAADHATISGPTAEVDPEPDLRALAEAGIDLDDVTAQLLREGVEKFVEPFEKLAKAIECKREAIFTSRPPTIEASIPDELEPRIAARVREATEAEVARRIWKKDPTLWGPEGTPEIADRLGWLTVTDQMQEAADDLEAFAAEVRDGGHDRRRAARDGRLVARPRGDPPQLRRTPRRLPDAARAGLHRRRRDPRAGGGDRPRAHAVPGVHQVRRDDRDDLALQALLVAPRRRPRVRRDHRSQARASRSSRASTSFRRTFLNDPNIGGRYSALSFFGLVPAALMGADIQGLLDRAGVAEQNCLTFDAARRQQRPVARTGVGRARARGARQAHLRGQPAASRASGCGSSS